MMIRTTRHRRFTRVDAMILGASIALGIWVWDTIPTYIEYALGLRENKPGVLRRIEPRARPKGDTPALTLTRWRNLTLGFGQMVLPFVTIGASIVTFRRRDGRSRHALRRVGIQTTAVGSAFVVISLVDEFALRRFQFLQVGYKHNPFDTIWGDLAVELSLAIAALWAVLALGRLWRAEPYWLDRLGRAVGVAWIMYTPLNVVPTLFNS